jgi:hypothetical protein
MNGRTRKNAIRRAVTATPAKLPAMPAASTVTLAVAAGDATGEGEAEGEVAAALCAVVLLAEVVGSEKVEEVELIVLEGFIAVSN